MSSEEIKSAEPGSDSSESIPMSIEEVPMPLKKKRDGSLSVDGFTGKKKKISAEKTGSKRFGFHSGYSSDSAIIRKKNVSGSGQTHIQDEPIAGCSENGNMQMPDCHTHSPMISTADSESLVSHPDLDNVLLEFESEVDPIEPNLPNEVFTGQTCPNEASATSISGFGFPVLGIEVDLSNASLFDVLERAVELEEEYESQSNGSMTNAGRPFTPQDSAATAARDSNSSSTSSNGSITSSNSSGTSSNISSTHSNSSFTSSNRSSTPTAGTSLPVASVPPPRQRPVPPPVASTSAGPPAGAKKRPRFTYDQILHSIVNYKRNMEKYLEQERNKPPRPPKKKPEHPPFSFGYVGPAKPGDVPPGSKIFGDKSWERPLEPGPDEFPWVGPFDALMNRLAYDEEMKELAKDFTPLQRDKPYKPLNRGNVTWYSL